MALASAVWSHDETPHFGLVWRVSKALQQAATRGDVVPLPDKHLPVVASTLHLVAGAPLQQPLLDQWLSELQDAGHVRRVC
eukprot:CAMPEP_0171126874 /NCGR_PEP_ID=MMETSP0766_2-20121228/114158_1 /TAXON_ID=439317 /ORGANISM="Gambierdiscus australes, Strain CAWD 149" /LENGTH=80 /DNA_ID=CAMNT_0011589943 /DNA_START=326 /DNA_END=568 /DNA_ORIENTATION=+